MSLATNWWGLISLILLNVGGWGTAWAAWVQSRRNGAIGKEAGDAAKEVGVKVDKIQGQVTNGGTNLATVVGQINTRTRLIETYFENLPNQQDIAGLRGDVRGLNSRVDALGQRVQAIEERPA